MTQITRVVTEINTDQRTNRSQEVIESRTTLLKKIKKLSAVLPLSGYLYVRHGFFEYDIFTEMGRSEQEE